MNTVVILPTYNEKDNIGKLIDEIKKYPVDILVVDDSSPDGTADVVRKKKVNLLINKEKQGLGKAYLTGMKHAVEKLKADVLIQMDADFSHDPSLLPEFLKEIKKNDMVLGSRYIKGGSIPKNWSVYRKFLSYFGNLFIRFSLGWKIHDWSTGYRAVRKEVYENLKKEMEDEMHYGYTFQVVFLYKALHRDFMVKEIPLNFKNRKHGESKLGPEYLKNTFKYILKTKLS